MPKPKQPSEAEVIFNRATLALAKNQRLVASWLPPRSEAELANSKSQEELDREEEEMFKPVPELLGVGATIPGDKDGLPQKSSASALNALKVQLLGKKASQQTSNGHTAAVKKPQPSTVTASADESEEEESRASMLTGKKARVKPSKRKPTIGDDDDAINESTSTPHDQDVEELPTINSKKKRSSNFMDEVLQKKSKKKKKRS